MRTAAGGVVALTLADAAGVGMGLTGTTGICGTGARAIAVATNAAFVGEVEASA